MPIYEYECADCGARKEHLQKLSAAPLAACPACGSASYAKRLTAAGFQLKGSGWYATDFKGSSGASSGGASSGATSSGSASSGSASSAAPEAAAPAACGTGCACH